MRAAALALLAVVASAANDYTWSAVNGVFSVNTLTVMPSGPFAAGQVLTVRGRGASPPPREAGTRARC